MSGRGLIRKLQSRSFAVSLVSIALVFGSAVVWGDPSLSVTNVDGLIYSTSQPWIRNPYVSFIINFLLLLVIGIIPVFLNRRFKIFRLSTWFFVGLFFMMQLCFPALFLNFCPSTVFALLLCVMTILLFSVYADVRFTRVVFIISFLLVSVSLWVACVFYLLPAALICLWQMRILTSRTSIAFLLGIITPLWIVWGFELAAIPFSVNLPATSVSLGSVLVSFSRSALCSFILILLSGFAFSIAALMKIINYNSSRKAFNGVLVTLILYMIILVFIDPQNITTYLTALSILAALEIAHVLSVATSEKSWIWMIAFPVCFFLLSLGNVL